MIMGVAMSIRGAPVEMRGQLCGTSSLCPPCRTLRLNSGHQPQQQEPLPSHWPIVLVSAQVKSLLCFAVPEHTPPPTSVPLEVL